MKQFLESVTAVIHTRLQTAEGGAKDMLEAALRAAERIGSVEDAAPADLLAWAARDLVVRDRGGVSQAADEFDELAKIAKWEIHTPQIAAIDLSLIEGIGAFRRSGDLGALADCLTEAAFGEALTDPDMPKNADEAFLAAVRRECSTRIPEIAGHVRSRLTEATDGVVAVGLVYGELNYAAIASIAAAKVAA